MYPPDTSQDSRIKANWRGIGVMAGMLAGALIGGDAGEALMIGSYAAGTQAMLSYSRDDEREADQLGFKKAYLAGFKPMPLSAPFQNCSKGSGGLIRRRPICLPIGRFREDGQSHGHEPDISRA
jgi:predicted Zn-dependent protease